MVWSKLATELGSLRNAMRVLAVVELPVRAGRMLFNGMVGRKKCLSGVGLDAWLTADVLTPTGTKEGTR